MAGLTSASCPLAVSRAEAKPQSILTQCDALVEKLTQKTPYLIVTRRARGSSRPPPEEFAHAGRVRDPASAGRAAHEELVRRREDDAAWAATELGDEGSVDLGLFLPIAAERPPENSDSPPPTALALTQRLESAA